MDGLNAQVLRGFSLKCRSVAKEKSYFVCGTDMGLKTVRKYTPNGNANDGAVSEGLEFQHAVKEALNEGGFPNTDRFALSADGLPYLRLDGDIYTVTDYFLKTCRESDFTDNSEFISIVRTVSEMHSVLGKADIKGVKVKVKTDPANETAGVFEKHSADLKSYKKVAAKRPCMSDFDVMFLKNFDFFMRSLSAWHDSVSQGSYAAVIREGAENRHICHNLLKEETVLKSSAGDVFFIVNFQECGAAHYIRDLSDLIKRYVRTMPERYIPLKEIVNIYCERNPLSDASVSAAGASLLFPDRFLALCERYYSQKRTWIPAAFLKRMEEITEHRDRQFSYISECFPL